MIFYDIYFYFFGLVTMNRKCSRNKKLKYLNEEKLVLGELAQKNKEEYDAEKLNEMKEKQGMTVN